MNKKKSIVIFVLIAVFIIAAGVLSVVQFPIGLYDYNGYANAIKLGLDLSGGVSAVFDVTNYELDDNGNPVYDNDGNLVYINTETLKSSVEGTVERMQALLVSKGYTESIVSYDMSGSAPVIRVEVPDVDDPERIFTLISRPASLKFVNYEEYEENPNTATVYILGSKHLSEAKVVQHYDSSTSQATAGKYDVGLVFNDTGAEAFADATSELSSDGTKTGYFTVLVNNEVYMEKVSVSKTISGGSAVIQNQTGYDYEEAYDLATALQAGTFGVNMEVRETKVLGPTLGQNAIKNSLIAGAIGLALVMIFMALIYKKLGILADVALCIYIELLLIFCSILPWVQLTLPGIAGIVLGIGMAVDANIIIFERAKDEYRSGKTLINALDIGFKKGRIAIIDANITTIIGAVVLWIFGGSSIVGFAITLLISIVISMFTALVITHSFIKLALPFDSINAKSYGLKREVAENE